MHRDAREGDPEGINWNEDRLEERISKRISSKMTIRLGLMLVAVIGVSSAIMAGIADSQVKDHQVINHEDLVSAEMLQSSEIRLEKKIDEVKGDLQQDITQIQDGQVRMENKLDHMMEILLDHDRNPGR